MRPDTKPPETELPTIPDDRSVPNPESLPPTMQPDTRRPGNLRPTIRDDGGQPNWSDSPTTNRPDARRAGRHNHPTIRDDDGAPSRDCFATTSLPGARRARRRTRPTRWDDARGPSPDYWPTTNRRRAIDGRRRSRRTPDRGFTNWAAAGPQVIKRAAPATNNATIEIVSFLIAVPPTSLRNQTGVGICGAPFEASRTKDFWLTAIDLMDIGKGLLSKLPPHIPITLESMRARSLPTAIRCVCRGLFADLMNYVKISRRS